MGATSCGNEMSENLESKSSCNSFLVEALVDDADDVDAPTPRSRSYYCNRFSSHALLIMLAVYLMLLGSLAVATETNETTAILTQPPEALKSTATQDIDNEISTSLEENPVTIEKENFPASTLTENLEDTIRSSVKSEIEMEQNVGSPALLNALNVMPETENIVLVEYTAATTSAPKHEQTVEPIPESQCDASSLVCIRPIKKELSPSTSVNDNEDTAAASVKPEIEIASTTTVVPKAVEATPVPETSIPQIIEQGVREGRTLESESVVQHEGQVLISEGDSSVVKEIKSQTVPENTSDNAETTLLSSKLNAVPTPVNDENLDIHSVESQVFIGPENALSNNEQNLDSTSLNDLSSDINHSNIAETELQNGPVDPSVSLLKETDEASDNLSNHLPTLSETNSESPSVEKEEPSEPIVVAENDDTLNRENVLTSSPQNEVELPPVEATNNASETNVQTLETIEHPEAQTGPVQPETQSTQTDILPVQTQDLTEIQNAPTETQHNPTQAEAVSTQNNIETNSEPQAPAIELESDLVQPVSSDSDNSDEAVQSLQVTTTPSSELIDAPHSNLKLENDTLSIIFEEPLTATELPVPQVDDYIKTIIEMEDPLLIEAQIDQTTVQPELSVHNVIKKQGVEPIDVEVPINIVDSDPESTTLTPTVNIPLAEVENLQPVQPAQENVLSSTPEVPSIEIVSAPNLTTDLPADITEVSVVFPGKGDDDAVLNGKGSRSINALHSPLTGHHKASINFDVYPAGQTFNENLAEDGIGKALPTHRLGEQSTDRSTLVIALCSGTAVLFIVISVTIFMVSFQRQHGTLDIEMQERRDNINDDEAETCVKLLDIELVPNTSLVLQTEAEAEIEECL